MESMRLMQFRVKDFKSVQDSGVIKCENITNLIGVNEAGKSNLLLALWKLNPARNGEIIFTSDMPVEKLAEYRTNPEKYYFIEAEFEIIKNDLIENLSNKFGIGKENFANVLVSRNYAGEYIVKFPKLEETGITVKNILSNCINDFKKQVNPLSNAGKGEEGFKESLMQKLDDLLSRIDADNDISTNEYLKIKTEVVQIEKSSMATSLINPQIEKFVEKISMLEELVNFFNGEEKSNIRDLVINNLPSFVYYANYGNLDSEIYLPKVIKDFKSTKEHSEKFNAKIRTLKVLFDYVNLSPDEIMEMGQYSYRIKEYGTITELTDEQIKTGQEKTKEREVLLNSASTKLTKDFKEWWKQGDYIFDLRADGEYFRIWVSDEKRPARIPLEDRSTGLQWFLSFFMVFLVESKDSHKNCVLLLDEAGTSLHPMAQKDLLNFFENLSITNQIITTTHSPFLVDVNHLERTKVVFVDDKGYTKVSEDLRAGEKKKNATGAVYAVHAALGLSVSEGLLNGCDLIVVEGQSDQFYLNAIKQYLIFTNKISPVKEMIFVPAGGVKSVKQLTSLIAGKQQALPVVVLDSDRSGKDYASKLEKELYFNDTDKILMIKDYVGIENAEIEDLFPAAVLERPIERIINDRDFRFKDEFDSSKPVISQIEEWANIYSIILDQGYKVELAKDIKRDLTTGSQATIVPTEYEEKWVSLFKKIIG
ncbi:MAG: AAA family ATPase [Solobacterium sp.]|nr:AAA family ATPase [Solobacterium sp.]